MRVSCETVLPINWKSFLRVDDNKTALFHFLANQISLIDVPNGKVIVTTLGENVLVNGTDLERAGLEPCNHEEADTRMLLHCQHAFNQEARKLMCVATDTDVVVIAIASATRFIDCEAWIEFGHGKHKRYIPLHSITASLGQDKSLALPFFHAFSGCDTISSFKGIGEKKAWDTWQVFPDATPVYMILSSLSLRIAAKDFAILERFIILMYRRTSHLRTVNETRLQLFAQGGRQIDMVPPTQAALTKHTQ